MKERWKRARGENIIIYVICINMVHNKDIIFVYVFKLQLNLWIKTINIDITYSNCIYIYISIEKRIN